MGTWELYAKVAKMKKMGIQTQGHIDCLQAFPDLSVSDSQPGLPCTRKTEVFADMGYNLHINEFFSFGRQMSEEPNWTTSRSQRIQSEK